MNKQVFIAVLMCLMILGGGALVGAQVAASEVPLSPEDEQAIKDAPDTFSDMGTYHVVVVRGKTAFVLYEQYHKHNIIVDEDKRLILILDLTVDI